MRKILGKIWRYVCRYKAQTSEQPKSAGLVDLVGEPPDAADLIGPVFFLKKLAVTACLDDLVEGLPEAVASLAGLAGKSCAMGWVSMSL